MPYRTPAAEPVRLRLLDRVAVKTRCDVPWDEMTGDDTVRFCARCQKPVYDLMAMAAEDANAFLVARLAESGELPCARVRVRKDGRVVADECRVGREKTHAQRMVRTLAAVAILATGGTIALEQATRPTLNADVPEERAPPRFVRIEALNVVSGMLMIAPEPEPQSR